jgi:hypothetical protein
MDGCKEDRSGRVSQVEDRLVESKGARKLMQPLLVLE